MPVLSGDGEHKIALEEGFIHDIVRQRLGGTWRKILDLGDVCDVLRDGCCRRREVNVRRLVAVG